MRLGLRDVARRCAVASQPDVPSGTTRGIEADEETEKPDHRTSAPVATDQIQMHVQYVWSRYQADFPDCVLGMPL